MRKYQVLIVDDEEMIADGLRFLIERGLPDCQVVGVAHDGTEGYQAALELQPDIILTDVCMCEMDGIEMIRRLKKAGLDARCIVLSGYEEFEYARQAILLGVDSYITKPVEEKELYQTFQEVCGLIQEKRQNAIQMTQLQEQVDIYTERVKKYQMIDLLKGNVPDHIQETERSEFLLKPFFLCAVFEYAGDSSSALIPDVDMFFSQCCAEQTGKEYLFEALVEKDANQCVLILGSDRMTEMRGAKMLFGRLRMRLRERLGVPVCGACGIWHRGTDGIKKSYDEALCALNYKIIRGSECLLSYDEIKEITYTTPIVSQEDILSLESSLVRMDNDGCRRTVETVFRKLQENGIADPEQLRVLALNLVLYGVRKVPFVQLQLNKYLGKNILSLDSISRFHTMDQLKHWIINALCAINEVMLKQDIPEKRDVVQEVKEYIAQNFDQDITLTDISSKFFINPYYFSQLFKKKTGDTYQNYLTGIRIARAKKLLEETDLKIYEICEMTGYSDADYFSKIFEKREGMKPSSYRKQKIHESASEK